MVDHSSAIKDEEVTVSTYTTFEELGELDLKAAYADATGNTLPDSITLTYNSTSKCIIYTNNGIRVTYNSTNNSITSVEEV